MIICKKGIFILYLFTLFNEIRTSKYVLEKTQLFQNLLAEDVGSGYNVQINNVDINPKGVVSRPIILETLLHHSPSDKQLHRRHKRYFWRTKEKTTTVPSTSIAYIHPETSATTGSSWRSWFSRAASSVKKSYGKVKEAIKSEAAEIKESVKNVGAKIARGFTKLRLYFTRSDDKFAIFANKVKERVDQKDEKALDLLHKLGIDVNYDKDGIPTNSVVNKTALPVKDVLMKEGILYDGNIGDHKNSTTATDRHKTTTKTVSEYHTTFKDHNIGTGTSQFTTNKYLPSSLISTSHKKTNEKEKLSSSTLHPRDFHSHSSIYTNTGLNYKKISTTSLPGITSTLSFDDIVTSANAITKDKDKKDDSAHTEIKLKSTSPFAIIFPDRWQPVSLSTKVTPEVSGESSIENDLDKSLIPKVTKSIEAEQHSTSKFQIPNKFSTTIFKTSELELTASDSYMTSVVTATKQLPSKSLTEILSLKPTSTLKSATVLLAPTKKTSMPSTTLSSSAITLESTLRLTPKSESTLKSSLSPFIQTTTIPTLSTPDFKVKATSESTFKLPTTIQSETTSKMHELSAAEASTVLSSLPTLSTLILLALKTLSHSSSITSLEPKKLTKKTTMISTSPYKLSDSYTSIILNATSPSVSTGKTFFTLSNSVFLSSSVKEHILNEYANFLTPKPFDLSKTSRPVTRTKASTYPTLKIVTTNRSEESKTQTFSPIDVRNANELITLLIRPTVTEAVASSTITDSPVGTTTATEAAASYTVTESSVGTTTITKAVAGAVASSTVTESSVGTTTVTEPLASSTFTESSVGTTTVTEPVASSTFTESSVRITTASSTVTESSVGTTTVTEPVASSTFTESSVGTTTLTEPVASSTFTESSVRITTVTEPVASSTVSESSVGTTTITKEVAGAVASSTVTESSIGTTTVTEPVASSTFTESSVGITIVTEPVPSSAVSESSVETTTVTEAVSSSTVAKSSVGTTTTTTITLPSKEDIDIEEVIAEHITDSFTETSSSSTITELTTKVTKPTTPPPFPDIFGESGVRDRLHEIFMNGDFSHDELRTIFEFDPALYESFYDYD